MDVEFCEGFGPEVFKLRNAGFCTCYTLKNVIQMLFLLTELLLFLFKTHLGFGEFPGETVLSGYHKPGVVLVRCNDGKSKLLFPLGFESLLGNAVEMHRNTGFLKLLDNCRVILAPYFHRIQFLPESLDGFRVFRVTHKHSAGKPYDVPVDVFRNGSFGDIDFFQTLDESVYDFHPGPKVSGLVVNALGIAGNVHQANLLKLLQKVFLLSIQQNEGVFCHPGNHTSEASSSSA